MKVSGTCDVTHGTVSNPSNTHLKPPQPSCRCHLAPPVLLTRRTGHKRSAELAVTADIFVQGCDCHQRSRRGAAEKPQTCRTLSSSTELRLQQPQQTLLFSSRRTLAAGSRGEIRAPRSLPTTPPGPSPAAVCLSFKSGENPAQDPSEDPAKRAVN